MKMNKIAAAAVASMSLVVALAATSASALPLYSSDGFEPSPRFTPNASLEGQDLILGPWQITSNLNPAQATVRPSVGVGGSQGVEVVTSSGKTDTQWYVSKPVLPDATLNTVNVNWAMNYTDTNVNGLTFGPFFGVEVYDASNGVDIKQIGGFGVDSSTGELLLLVEGTGGAAEFVVVAGPTNTVAAGQYNNYSISVDYTNDVYSVLLNGTVLETVPFIDDTAVAFTDAPISTRFISEANEENLNAGTAFFDNYNIQVVPEPTILGGIAALALGMVRRRR